MAVPTKYTPSYSYSGFEAVNPALPKPGAQFDNDFTNISRSINQAVDALGDVRRSDGKLKNSTVGPDQLSDALVIGFTLRGGWTDATVYNAGDGVTYGDTFYKANVTHTSAPGSRPDLDSTTWSFLLTFSAIALTDGSVTPVKLDATAAAGFRAVIGQEETVAEGVANVTAKATPVDADKLPLVDSENSGNLRGLTFSALATWIATKLGPLTSAQTEKTAPVDADTLVLADSAATNATKKLTWANVKAELWTALGSLINGGTGKTTPVDGDIFVIADSAASSATKKLTLANLRTMMASATETLANKTLSTPTLILKQSASPAPTTEGAIEWDTNDDRLVVGDGSSQKLFYPVLTGVFTPTITFGGASVGNVYSAQVGMWTKVGNLVTVQIGIILSTKGSSTGSARIAGLPFANRTGGRGSLAPGFCVGLSSLNAGLGFIMNSASSVVDIQIPGSTGSGTVATHSHFNSGTEIQASGSYLTD